MGMATIHVQCRLASYVLIKLYCWISLEADSWINTVEPGCANSHLIWQVGYVPKSIH